MAKKTVIQKFKFRKPFKKNGRTNLPEAKKKSGVYLIKKDKKIVYIGYSGSQLYKTLYNHFYEWNDSTQVRISYKKQLNRHDFSVRIVYCSPKRAENLEKALILKHNPKDNTIKYKNYLKDAKANEIKNIDSMKQIYDFAPLLTEAPF